MPVNFDELTRPIQGTRFHALRAGQRVALEVYSERASVMPDLAIELPTGAGKTLIALLVLDYWRRQGKRVAVLTGNKTLARQIEAEAAELRVPTVRFEGRGRDFPPADVRRYHRSQAIAVMNYWAYINQNPGMDAAEYLVLDDAQLADGALNSLFTASIARHGHPTLFGTLMRLIARESESPIAEDFVRDIAAGPSVFRNVDLIAFPIFDRMRNELEVAVDEYLTTRPDGETDSTRDLRFRWGRMRPKLDGLMCLVSPDEVELRPGCPPAQGYDGLRAPSQRIYMSATLHDPGDLQRRLGCGPIVKIDLPPDAMLAQDGRRLFVFNQQSSLSARTSASDEVLAPLRELIGLTKKSVWLCTSGSEADHWEDWLRTWLEPLRREGGGEPEPIWRLTPTGDELEQFRAAQTGHLLIAGRFEGMDFPDDVCRLAVLPSLPSATGLLERFTTEQLRDARFQHLRVLERVKQAIGRCTRGDQDHAVYFFLDPRFYSQMESGEFNGLVSERTRRQVELGLRLTEDGMGNVVPVARAFLRGEFAEFDRLQDAAEPPPPRARRAPALSTAPDEVAGWLSLVETRDFAAASASFARVVQGLQDAEREHRGFWTYLQAFAEYLRGERDGVDGARDRSLTLLGVAIREGASSSWFNRVRKAVNQMRGELVEPDLADLTPLFEVWDQFVEVNPYQGGRFLRWQARLQTFIAGTHGQVCEALETIGSLLGFAATRPRGDAAADGIWRQGDAAITLEAKIETTRANVVYTDVNQADGQRRSAVHTLRIDERQVDALVVTNLREIAPEASAALGRVRVLKTEQLEGLRLKLEEVQRDYWSTWSRDDAAARMAARAAAARRMPRAGWLARAITGSPGPFISHDELFAEWR